MNEFSGLRARAKERHDRLCAEAGEQYERTLAQIDLFENDLTGRTRQRRSIIASIEAVIPADKEFSVDGLMLSLQELDDSRAWKSRELTVAVVEAGYESKRSRRKLLEAIGQILWKDERFKRDGERWSVISSV